MWAKAFHLIFMVTWFAGLFYLPRLFVYHSMSADIISIERFKIMERKLYWGIMTPGLLLTLVCGVWMLVDYAWVAFGSSGWLHIKLTLMILLIGYHVQCGRWLRDFANDSNQRSHVFFRWVNEIPVLFLFAIIYLAVLKPF